LGDLLKVRGCHQLWHVNGTKTTLQKLLGRDGVAKQCWHFPGYMATLYLLVFAQAHEEFRVPELLSVSKLYGFNVTFPRDAKDRDTTRPFMVLGLEDEDHARLLAKRCVLVKWAS
jgi:hypothetical protein